jgi:hypothetical protein
MTDDAPSARPATRTVGGVATLAAAAAQVVTAFLAWAADGTTAVDLPLVTSNGATLPTIGLILIGLAAVPAVAVLTSRRGWPRLVSAVATAALVLWWLLQGRDAALVPGVWTAIGATTGHFLAAALAD